MTIYNIHYTEKSKPTINIDETEVNMTATDLEFFGRRRLQYGQDLNQNIMFLLEHFACPEDALHPGNPNTTIAVNPSNSSIDFTPLRNPTDGQIWYNSTQQRPFVWDASTNKWIPIAMEDDIAANWGIIYHGQQLPQPISSKTGYVFNYSECSWIVSPYQFPAQVDYMLCDTDANAFVNSLYSLNGDPSTILKGFATYLIVGIKGNINQGSLSPIPSATPTPQISPTPTSTPQVTPSPTPTSTPAATPTYTGPLQAYFGPRVPMEGPFVALPNMTKPYYAGDYHRATYPGITSTKYKILYASTAPLVLQTTPAAPHNPWDNVSGQYYIYITDTATSGGMGNFSALNALYHSYIFCTGKSTESGTNMVEGIDGLFFKVSNITSLGSIVQIQLNVTPLTSGDIALYGHPPIQSSPIDMLTFNYDYVYAMGAYYTNNPSLVSGQVANPSCSGVGSTDPNAQFYLCPPTKYATAFDLYIQGGTPPYTITDIKYWGPLGTGQFTSFSSVKTPSLIKTGFTGSGSTSLPAPVSFTDLTTATSTKPLFVGPVTFPNPSNSNIEQIANGYVIRQYATADMYYGPDFATKYGTSCQPEWRWYWSYPYGSGSQCAALTGNSTLYGSDSFAVTIQDSVGTTIQAPISYGLAFQTIDYDTLSQGFFFSPIVVSGPNSGTIVGAGTYTYGIQAAFATTSTSMRPMSSPAQLQYVMSLFDSTQGNSNPPTAPGQFQYPSSGGVTGTTTTALLPRPTTGNCTSATTANSLIHIGCDISNANPDLQCPSGGGYLSSGYSTGQLPPGAYQQVRITKVWRNNGTPGVVDISATPIIVRLSVLSAPLGSLNNSNTYAWGNLLPDRTGQHTGNFTSPRVPYNMKIDVTIPSGLNFSGTLSLGYGFFAYDNPNGGCAFGAAGGPVGNIVLNFANT